MGWQVPHFVNKVGPHVTAYPNIFIYHHKLREGVDGLGLFNFQPSPCSPQKWGGGKRVQALNIHTPDSVSKQSPEPLSMIAPQHRMIIFSPLTGFLCLQQLSLPLPHPRPPVTAASFLAGQKLTEVQAHQILCF